MENKLPSHDSPFWGVVILLAFVVLGVGGLGVFNAKVASKIGEPGDNKPKAVSVKYVNLADVTNSSKSKACGMTWKNPADGKKAKATKHNATLTLTFDGKGKLVEASSNPEGAFHGKGNGSKFTWTAQLASGSPLYTSATAEGAVGEYQVKGGETAKERTGGLPPKPSDKPFTKVVWCGWK